MAPVSCVHGVSFSSVLLLVGAVILATTLTQAFEFGAIRMLEGYWVLGTSEPLSLRGYASGRHGDA